VANPPTPPYKGGEVIRNFLLKLFLLLALCGTIGFGLVNGGCVVFFGVECVNNGDCPNGEFCSIDGVCIFIDDCVTSLDCSGGHVCGPECNMP
jgi:hypothetical protein